MLFLKLVLVSDNLGKHEWRDNVDAFNSLSM